MYVPRVSLANWSLTLRPLFLCRLKNSCDLLKAELFAGGIRTGSQHGFIAPAVRRNRDD
jgi:hypothetical protein